MYGSLKELKKASCAAGKNSDDRMTSVVRMMEKKERELKEKRDVTKSTLVAVKLEKIEGRGQL